MKQDFITEVMTQMLPYLNNAQLQRLKEVMDETLQAYELSERGAETQEEDDSRELIALFLAAKRIEGCSEKTLSYYEATIEKMVVSLDKNVRSIQTQDLRDYLTQYQAKRRSSRVTIDNMRRILSSFFAWLEDEDYTIKSPVRRIHKIKTATKLKASYTDEQLERMRDHCSHPRDLAMIDMLASTGMQVGEMARLDRADINFAERECVVLEKGDKERKVNFDARTKLHLQEYLQSRTDSDPALFVTLHAPHDRLQIGGSRVGFGPSAGSWIFHMCIHTSFGGPWPLRPSTRGCRLSRSSICSAISASTRPCNMRWLRIAMSKWRIRSILVD